MALAQINGTRLEFVVVPLPGTVKRFVHRMVPHEAGRHKDGSKRFAHTMTKELVEQPAGFMVYFPRGHAIRVRDQAQLKRYRLHRQPRLINLTGLNDPNSPYGKLMAAQDSQGRHDAMEELRKQVIQLATVKSGPRVLTRVEKHVEID